MCKFMDVVFIETLKFAGILFRVSKLICDMHHSNMRILRRSRHYQFTADSTWRDYTVKNSNAFDL